MTFTYSKLRMIDPDVRSVALGNRSATDASTVGAPDGVRVIDCRSTFVAHGIIDIGGVFSETLRAGRATQ